MKLGLFWLLFLVFAFSLFMFWERYYPVSFGRAFFEDSHPKVEFYFGGQMFTGTYFTKNPCGVTIDTPFATYQCITNIRIFKDRTNGAR